jgi:hypothetical protein
VDDRRAVERAIHAAFAGAERRPPAPRVRTDRSHDPFMAELERALADAGDEPDASFLVAHTFASEHFTPPTRRWWTRAMVLATLDAPWERREQEPRDHSPSLQLVHTTPYWLRPNPCAVLAGTREASAAILREQLTADERVAISRFLGLYLDSPAFQLRGLPYLASQAIAWGWHDDDDASAAAERLRASARQYRRPPAADPDDEALLVAIERAFAGTPPPPGRLVTSVDEESADYALELAGTPWHALEPWFLELNVTAFSFMTPEAFRYYLPAVLIADVMGHAVTDPVFHLAIWPRPERPRRSSRALIAAFSPAERSAIARYLRHAARLRSDPTIDRALEVFWDVSPA